MIGKSPIYNINFVIFYRQLFVYFIAINKVISIPFILKYISFLLSLVQVASAEKVSNLQKF